MLIFTKFVKDNSVHSITILSALIKINPQPQHRLNAIAQCHLYRHVLD